MSDRSRPAPTVEFVARSFDLEAPPSVVEPFGRGNIHDSYRISAGGGFSYLLQRINQRVFPDVDLLMANLLAVSRHLGGEPADRRSGADWCGCPAPIPARDGSPYTRTEDGEAYRVFRFVENSMSHRTVRGPEQAYLAARAFGRLQAALSTLEPRAIPAVIPGFHDTRRRFADFRRVLHARSGVGARDATAEIGFAVAREDWAGRLLGLMDSGRIPVRLVHNDAKLDNVLFDRDTGEVLCVCDLDTVMAGSGLYDFGDLVRTAAVAGAEDDAEKASLRMDLFEALAEGYLEAGRGFLNETERGQLVFAGLLITFETGLRFLTDHLDGDTYFKCDYSGHNLARCRAQFGLVVSLERNAARMNRVVRRLGDR